MSEGLSIGVPSEVKSHEYRVSMLPVGVEALISQGHQVYVQCGAGQGSGYEDEQYQQAGATMLKDAEEVFDQSQLIIKVKEPQPQEWSLLKEDQVVFTYFHFAASRTLTEACIERGIVALAYETLTVSSQLPLLTPMSEVAGRMSVQEGAKYLEKPMMGRGILLGGVSGVEPGNVLILGAGIVGTNAARMAAGLGAHVTIMDIDIDRLRHIDQVMPPNVHTSFSHAHAVADHAIHADLIIGSVLIPGGRTPVLVNRELVASMKQGAVIIDVGVDQGGCVETIKPTTHEQPTYIVDGVVHYGVSNMPGAVGRTSTQALCHATQPYVIELANGLASNDLSAFLQTHPIYQSSLNVYRGKIEHRGVSQAFPDLPSNCQ